MGAAMSMEESNNDVAVGDLELGVPEALKRVSAGLCDLKLMMDRQARRAIGQPFLNEWMGRQGTCAFHGHTFLHLLIPFLDWERSEGPEFKAYVDPRYVLGASIKGYPEDVPESEVQGRIARYAEEFGSRDHVLYDWYRPLGILCAHEGKHRVAFMRAHGVSRIAAWVAERQYPAASRLALVAPTNPGDAWLVVLDNRYVQVLLRPRVSMEFLQVYGVECASWKGQETWADEELVRQEIEMLGLRRPPEMRRESDRTLDMASIQTFEQQDSRPATLNLFQAAGWTWNWRFFLCAALASILLAGILGVFDSTDAQMFAYLGYGFGVGMLMAIGTLRFRRQKSSTTRVASGARTSEPRK